MSTLAASSTSAFGSASPGGFTGFTGPLELPRPYGFTATSTTPHMTTTQQQAAALVDALTKKPGSSSSPIDTTTPPRFRSVTASASILPSAASGPFGSALASSGAASIASSMTRDSSGAGQGGDGISHSHSHSQSASMQQELPSTFDAALSQSHSFGSNASAHTSFNTTFPSADESNLTSASSVGSRAAQKGKMLYSSQSALQRVQSQAAPFTSTPQRQMAFHERIDALAVRGQAFDHGQQGQALITSSSHILQEQGSRSLPPEPTENSILRQENAELRQMVDSLIREMAAMEEVHREQANTSVGILGGADMERQGASVGGSSQFRASPAPARLAENDAFDPTSPRFRGAGLPPSKLDEAQLRIDTSVPSVTDVLPPQLHAMLMKRGSPFQPSSSASNISTKAYTDVSARSAPSPAAATSQFSGLPGPSAIAPPGGDRWGALRATGSANLPSAGSGARRTRASGPILRNGSVDTLVHSVLDSRVSQDASIALQQQLKQSDPARCDVIIDAMKPLLLQLAQDKHGNFLVQRAISVRPALVWDLKGKYVQLALSQFGCHVVLRMLDEPEDVKRAIVEELLREHLMETLSARTAVHIWQKALEIRWNDATFRARLFEQLNSTLRGKWSEFVMQETGSIICQNIFESADRAEKEECIQELLQHVPDCAQNQWGVWVIQHLIDHGDTVHRHAVFTRLLDSAVQLTMSQFGQKAIMTALKTSDPAFMVPYVDLLCSRDESSQTAISSSRRSVLIDIACTPQGFNVVTQLLTNVNNEQRERLIATVRRNSVFLKGSKAGLKVHTLCGESSTVCLCSNSHG